MVVNPVYNRRKEILWFHGITKKGMLQTLLERIGNESRGLEIHVSHPQRQQIVPTPSRQQRLVLEVATTRTVYDFVKIVFHLIYKAIE